MIPSLDTRLMQALKAIGRWVHIVVPPVLSPAELDLQKYGCTFEPNTGADLQVEPYTSKVMLTDGGVYDNLGLETVWKEYRTVLVSDAGGHVEPRHDPCDTRATAHWLPAGNGVAY